jgi:ankyrin repeat protein
VSQPVFRRSVLAIALLLGAPGAIAHAQVNTESHEFLEAVRDADGTKVTQIVQQPGNTLINTRDLATGDTALHIVADRDSDGRWLKFLIQNGANPNVLNKKGVTPLMIAAGKGNVDGVDALIKAGARVDEQDRLGETPLIAATHKRDVAMVKLLLANGADPDRTDNSGRSARDYVKLYADRRLTAEFDAADENRKGKSGPAYGPGL